MKTFRLAFLVLSVALLVNSVRAESVWFTDLAKAQTEAKTNHKLLLVDFTGSDWCIWCKKLHAEVFTQPEFESYAKDHLVLLTVDFPRRSSLAPDVQKQNEQLAAKYNIEGFPTVVVLNEAGKKVGELGYQPGGANAFVEELKKIPK